jgi:Ala-tRNA(Pro) deacylase
MSVLKSLKDYLDDNGIKYKAISHSPAYTAQEIAALVHVPGKELAKTVIVRTEDGYAMVVLPASRKINFDILKNVMSTKQVELAKEEEFEKMFPDCEVGAMPPFGNLYNLPIYVAKALSEDQEIVFNAGTHTDVIKMSYQDLERLVKPVVADFSERMN